MHAYRVVGWCTFHVSEDNNKTCQSHGREDAMKV